MNTKTANKPRRLLTRRITSARMLLASIHVFGPRLDAKAQGVAMGFLRPRVARVCRELRDKERHLRRRQVLKSCRIKERVDAAKTVRERLVGARRLALGVYGIDGLSRLGFPRRVSEDAEELVEQATSVCEHLNDEERALPPLQLPSLHLTWDAFAAELGELVKTLRNALDAVAEACADVVLAFDQRDQALAAFNLVYVHVSRILESLLRRTGLDGLAEKVRPSTRRPGLPHKPEELEQALGEAPKDKVADAGDKGGPGSADRPADGIDVGASGERPPTLATQELATQDLKKRSPVVRLADFIEKAFSGAKAREPSTPRRGTGKEVIMRA